MLTLPDTVPLQQLENALILQKGISLYVLRLDTIDRYSGGNKLFKLRYNLEEALRQEHKRILTFGGTWSNHLAAVAGLSRQLAGSRQSAVDTESAVSSEQLAVNTGAAVAGKRLKRVDLEIIAVVRGEEPGVYSDTLGFCKQNGVRLHFVSREEYRKRNETEFIESLRKKFGDFYLLPEGGSNAFAVKGCREILNYIPVKFDAICCPVGSGGTLAGIISGLKGEQNAIGFVALKGAEYMREEVVRLIAGERRISSNAPLSRFAGLSTQKGETTISFGLNHEYHFGGFAKVTDELLRFKKQFERDSGFELDYVYTSKMFYGLFDLISKGAFKPGSTIVAVHTGGLQGNKGFEQ